MHLGFRAPGFFGYISEERFFFRPSAFLVASPDVHIFYQWELILPGSPGFRACSSTHFGSS